MCENAKQKKRSWRKSIAYYMFFMVPGFSSCANCVLQNLSMALQPLHQAIELVLNVLGHEDHE